MAVEAATFISQLDQNLPASGGIAGEGDDHLRLTKDVLLNTIPLTGLVTALFTDLNLLTGAAANGLTVADMTKLATITASAAEINSLDGITASTTELNQLTGRTLASTDDVIDNFPAGTRLMFQQQTAPSGWTRDDTAGINHALRITNGAGWVGWASGTAFTTVFGRTATDDHQLTGAQSGIPAHSHSHTLGITAAGSHSHTVPASSDSGNTTNWVAKGGGTGATGNHATSTEPDHNHGGTLSGAITATTATSATAAHSHNMDMRVQFVDAIIAVKD